MAKKIVIKPNKKKPREITLPPLPVVKKTLLTGVCKCDGAVSMTVHLVDHPRLDWQMLTAHCRVCATTFYLTRGV